MNTKISLFSTEITIFPVRPKPYQKWPKLAIFDKKWKLFFTKNYKKVPKNIKKSTPCGLGDFQKLAKSGQKVPKTWKRAENGQNGQFWGGNKCTLSCNKKVSIIDIFTGSGVFVHIFAHLWHPKLSKIGHFWWFLI